jgi:hypothetical protein
VNISKVSRQLTLGAPLVALALFTTVCSKSAPEKPATSTAAKPLISDMTPVVSVKELMENMIDPLSDNIFDAVWWDNTAQGIEEHKPTTDEDWEKVKTGAVSIVEGIELLKVPRPWTPPGDLNDSQGPNAPELSPTQIQAKLDKDPVLWTAKIQALRNVGLEVLEIVKKKDANALWQAGGDLDDACEACHLEYWYPGDRATVESERKFKARFEKPGTK